jgi:hypothetical protein
LPTIWKVLTSDLLYNIIIGVNVSVQNQYLERYREFAFLLGFFSAVMRGCRTDWFSRAHILAINNFDKDNAQGTAATKPPIVRGEFLN